ERQDEEDVLAGHDVLRGAERRLGRSGVPAVVALGGLLVRLLVAFVVVFRRLVVVAVAVVVGLRGAPLVVRIRLVRLGRGRGLRGLVRLFRLRLAAAAALHDPGNPKARDERNE